MVGNSNFNNAKVAKNDEFYTQFNDIADELKHYKKHFRDKAVLCNCDDPYESNFFKYFALNFNQLGLKKLIATCYDGSLIADQQMALFEPTEEYGGMKVSKTKVPHKIVINEVKDLNGDGAIDMTDIDILLQNDKNALTRLKSNGDFRSNECVELLKEADVVVTNPPFSLFRTFISLLLQYDKKFIVIGPMNALHYKEIFPIIKANKMWAGFGFNKIFEFVMPDDYELKGKAYVDETGKKHGFVPGICWYTNLDIEKRHEDLILYNKYSPEKYPKYINFDGIDVSKVAEIPEDYYGNMGVPDSFLDSYNPDQFELIGIGAGDMAKEIGVTKNYRGRTDVSFMENGKPKCPYSRIIIRRKK